MTPEKHETGPGNFALTILGEKKIGSTTMTPEKHKTDPLQLHHDDS